ncbi:integral membrane protein [Camillea tinctor]|nr:integral membrane protein [Camillea tinctor]
MSSNGFIAWDPNLTDESKGQSIFALCVLFDVLIILSTFARVGTKLLSRMRLGAADYLIIICLTFNLAANSLEIQAVDNGFGRHLQFLTRDQALTIKRLSQYLLLLANISLWAVKISVCFFILTLIQDTHYRSKWTIYGLMIVTTASSLGQGIVWGLQARPLRKLWEPEIPGEVWSLDRLVTSIIVCTIINSLTDLFYALAPIYFFGGLQMALKKRLIILGLTGSGLLVFATSITRVAFDKDFYNPDSTWALHSVYLCTIIERNLAQIVADLPAIFVFFRSISNKARTIFSGSGTGTGSKSRRYGPKDPSDHSDQSFQKTPGRSARLTDTEVGPEEDEIPLRDSPEASRGNNNNITMQTTIDIQSYTASVHTQEQTQNDLIRPWNNMSAER